MYDLYAVHCLLRSQGVISSSADQHEVEQRVAEEGEEKRVADEPEEKQVAEDAEAIRLAEEAEATRVADKAKEEAKVSSVKVWLSWAIRLNSVHSATHARCLTFCCCTRSNTKLYLYRDLAQVIICSFSSIILSFRLSTSSLG